MYFFKSINQTVCNKDISDLLHFENFHSFWNQEKKCRLPINNYCIYCLCVTIHLCKVDSSNGWAIYNSNESPFTMISIIMLFAILQMYFFLNLSGNYKYAHVISDSLHSFSFSLCITKIQRNIKIKQQCRIIVPWQKRQKNLRKYNVSCSFSISVYH